MNVSRDVILDLLPVYLAGEASAATRALVDEYVKENPEFGRELRQQLAENLAAVAPPNMPPELELKTLSRTRDVLRRQRWLFGMAILFSLLPFSAVFTFQDGRLVDAYMLARDYPPLALASLVTGLAMWGKYSANKRRLRSIV